MAEVIGSARIAIQVHPHAKRTALTGRLGEAYKLHVAAPATDGRANAACVRFLADLARVPKSQVRIVTGLKSRTKLIAIEGLSATQLEKILANHL